MVGPEGMKKASLLEVRTIAMVFWTTACVVIYFLTIYSPLRYAVSHLIQTTVGS